MTGTGSFTASLSGLTPGETYHFRAKADGGAGGISYGADQQFTTSSGGSGPVVITYSYDSTAGGNYGKGLRTGMSDVSGSTTYKYDSWGRLIEENRTIYSDNYTTSFAYDGANRIEYIIYPTGENVTQDYNGRGLPYSLSGSAAGDIVDSVLYNSLGMLSEINLHNGVTTAYEYWGIDYDPQETYYYGRLWNINTNDGVDDLIDINYTWDAAGNLVSRQDVIASETESFGYDFLDRLTGVSGPYSESYTYDEIGNITSRNGVDYNYDSTQPHAVDSIDGFSSYTYDANGNMIMRGSQTIGWDAENRVVSVSYNGTETTFVYDGDGSRVKKTENGETIIYINQFYEKNLTTGVATTYYYLGGQLVAMREGTDLEYIHQDHLSSTSVMTDDAGDSLGAIKYLPFGETRSGSMPTDKQFTGQRLDGTGLYYYGARYYDPLIGRYISADPIIPRPWDPQSFNRYSYCYNNPLKYIDPSGYFVRIGEWNVTGIRAMQQSDIDYYLPSEFWEEFSDVVNSEEYQVYQELRRDEPGDMEEKENSDTIWQLSSLVDPREDEHDGNYNTIYLTSEEGDIHRYHWNADPAWWQDPQWQKDHFYNMNIGEIIEKIWSTVEITCALGLSIAVLGVVTVAQPWLGIMTIPAAIGAGWAWWMIVNYFWSS
jgi:RHS repeat-associated protein